MVDTEKLRQAVSDYQFRAKSSYSGHKDAPVTMRDMNKVISETVKVLNVFISELERGS